MRGSTRRARTRVCAHDLGHRALLYVFVCVLHSSSKHNDICTSTAGSSETGTTNSCPSGKPAKSPLGLHARFPPSTARICVAARSFARRRVYKTRQRVNDNSISQRQQTKKPPSTRAQAHTCTLGKIRARSWKPCASATCGGGVRGGPEHDERAVAHTQSPTNTHTRTHTPATRAPRIDCGCSHPPLPSAVGPRSRRSQPACVQGVRSSYTCARPQRAAERTCAA
jgi:hypothetical protein